MKFQNIVSPDRAYDRYFVIAEYPTKEEALSAYDADCAAWRERNKGKTWYKLNFPFSYACIGIKETEAA